jgi:hypothetical protein
MPSFDPVYTMRMLAQTLPSRWRRSRPAQPRSPVVATDGYGICPSCGEFVLAESWGESRQAICPNCGHLIGPGNPLRPLGSESDGPDGQRRIRRRRFPLPRMTTRRLMAFIAGLAGLLWILDQSESIGDGAYPLEIAVAGPSARSLFCAVCGNKFEADGLARMWMKGREPATIAEWDYQAKPFTGRPFSVRVRFSSHMTGLGRVLHEGRMRALFVAVQYDDGHRGFKIVEIPHRSVSQRVDVSLP